jgi:hypothetical protein
VDPDPPADAGEVVDAISESQILVAVLARAVVVAIQTLVNHYRAKRAQYVLEELTEPVVSPSQH